MESKGSVNGDEEEDQELDTDQPTTLPILRVAGHEGTKQQRREKQRENKDKVNGKFSCEKVDNSVDEESFIWYINMSRFLLKCGRGKLYFVHQYVKIFTKVLRDKEELQVIFSIQKMDKY